MNTDTALFVIEMAEAVMALEAARADQFLARMRAEISGEMIDVVEMAFRAGYSTAKTDVMALLATMAENGS